MTMLDTSVLEIKCLYCVVFYSFRDCDIWQTSILFQIVKYLTGNGRLRNDWALWYCTVLSPSLLYCTYSYIEMYYLVV